MRYVFFLFWYRQWFRNHDGIKAFAHQCINWVLRSTLRLARRLKRQNKGLAENIRKLSAELQKRLQHPTIEADEFSAIQGKIRSFNTIIIVCIVGEAFFNFFASKAIFNFPGYLSIAAQTIFAILVTWIAIALFENLFQEILHENPYKGEHKEGRNWPKLMALLVMAVGYEVFTFYICKVRGIQIEGGEGNGIISIAMMVAGMLIPVIAGFYAHEKRKYISPYRNTRRIERLNHLIAQKGNRIEVNKQRMENHFKSRCQENWAYLQEFKTYKENFNRKHGIPEENLAGHFCGGEKQFVAEAIERYQKKALEDEVLKPEILTVSARENGSDSTIKGLFAH